jgi:hypothetical protein
VSPALSLGSSSCKPLGVMRALRGCCARLEEHSECGEEGFEELSLDGFY